MTSLREIPSVDELLRSPQLAELAGVHSRPLVLQAVRSVLNRVRLGLRAASGAAVDLSVEGLTRQVEDALSALRRPSLSPAINATGVIVHTGLGRAILCEGAQRAVLGVAASACPLELDPDTGKRDTRDRHVADLICELTGARAAMVVNNNAAAVMLAVNTVAHEREVIISRGQLVEIGGSFRLPDVIKSSGARLVEVGTTNHTRISDYEAAIGDQTTLLLWVHASNYRIVGYTSEVSIGELSELGRRAKLPVMADLGSGALVDLIRFGIAGEPVARAAIEAGADLITFSGDKLLGGPQAGIIAGKADLVSAIKRNPIARAVRVDKLCLAALEATLREYRDPEGALRNVPVLAAITRPLNEIEQAARCLAAAVAEPLSGIARVHVSVDTTRIGGGSLPTEELATWVLSLEPMDISADELASWLRRAEPAVYGRVHLDSIQLDLRTVPESQVDALKEALLALASER